MIRDDQVAERTQRPGHYLLLQQRVVLLPSPAAGVDAVATVPATAQWELISLQAQLVTSAAVANRVPHLVLTDGQGHSLFNFPAANNQLAGVTKQYSGGVADVAADFDNAAALVLPYGLKLLQGWTVGFATTALDVADQWSKFNLLVKEWLSF